MSRKKQRENDIGNDILDFLQKRRGKSFKAKEISHALHVHKNNYHSFRDALQLLSRKGKIARLKIGRFTLPSTLQKVVGKIQLTRKGFGFVTDERTGEEIFIPAQHLNTALNEDVVEVQLFAVSRGKSKEGQIIAIRERGHRTFVGTYHRSEYYGFVVADNPRVYRDFYIQPHNNAGAKQGQKVVVEFLKWDAASLNPEGKIIEILGFPDEPGVDVVSVLKGFELPVQFPAAVEKEAQQIGFHLSNKILEHRLDLREETIFTIDPVDAKDFDDAVSLNHLDNGNYQLGVHIADVSHFVQEGSLVDKEAFLRGTSIYLVDRVVPMLPEHLSNELCSLQPGIDKLTFSCIMEISGEGEVINYELKPSVINSKRRFSYEEVQGIIDDETSTDPYAGILREMRDFSQKLRKLREQMGSIDFETPEVRFVLDKRGKPTEINPIERLQSHQLIEEFMLMANKTVARHVALISPKGKPLPFIYRVHERPDNDKITSFENFLNALGFQKKIPRNVSPTQFQEIMNSVLGTKDDILIKEVALRTMMKAIYDIKNVGHFGLAFTDYTHFTSPIRRYPDLAVHRLIKLYARPVEQAHLNSLEKHLKKVSDRSSDRERVALEAERESTKIKQVEWIADYVGKDFDGLISGVTAYGIFVEITPYLIEGFIRMEDMEDDYYLFDEKRYSLVGKEFGKVYRLGDEIKIRVKQVNREINQVDFVLADDHPGPDIAER
jgi:ribonuclease R